MSSTSRPTEASARPSPVEDAGDALADAQPADEGEDSRTPAVPVEIHFPVTLGPDGAVDWDVFLPPRAGDLAWRFGQRLKRIMDVVVAGVSLLVLLPLLVVVALAVLLTCGRPLFYACEYMGHRGRRFTLYKFRTMVPNADLLKAELAHLNEVKGPAFKIRRDPRVTGVGRFLRRYSLDELPQLWNVLRGDMSMVGPRPPLPEEWAEFQPWQRGKLAVVPGITCLWQVEGRSDITDFDEWAALDLRYIRDWSLISDLVILVRTIPAVLRGQGAY